MGNHEGMRYSGPVRRGRREREKTGGLGPEIEYEGSWRGDGACLPRLYKAPNPHWLGISGARIVPKASRVKLHFSSHACLFRSIGRSVGRSRKVNLRGRVYTTRCRRVALNLLGQSFSLIYRTVQSTKVVWHALPQFLLLGGGGFGPVI